MQQHSVPRDSIGLQNLPVELQTAILSHLTSLSDQPTLQAVLLTCKSLSRAARPLSVRTFRNINHKRRGGFCSERRNAKFIRYILLTRPELAISVETLIFGQFSSTPDMGNDARMPRYPLIATATFPEPECESDDLAIYSKHISNALGPNSKSEFAERWAADVEDGCSDAQLALLLICCPNLRTLCYENPCNQRYFLRALELSYGGNTLVQPVLRRPLSRLRYIYSETQSEHIWTEYPADRNPSPFFRLDSVRSFEGLMVSSVSEVEQSFAQMPARSSNVEDIAIRGSIVTPEFLQSMLGACKAVKRLEFIRRLNPAIVQDMLPYHVLTSILLHADSMEHLHLNFAEEFQECNPPHADNLCFDSGLRNMTSMKTLVTGMRSLTGLFNGYTSLGAPYALSPRVPRVEGAPNLVDCLPENLESLEIHRCGEDILEQAQQLISVVQEGKSFKRLKRVRLLFDQEKVDPDKIRLSFDPAVIHVEIVFQSLRNRLFDLIPSSWEYGRRVDAISSPIYCQESREHWLAVRGGDIGLAKLWGDEPPELFRIQDYDHFV
ncbi:unnamed protein product [Clonostachys rosea]|uniref:F-box domain-containing protein n=1 Tax=Bionectria ochroleuca TaxID=29856 RepID=A0ABY6UQP5_BIOOC|nr:unnamed protein product [Clonostachys rosea]